ncbi:MAG: signal recognition particle protein [Gammaproteobacteria bacterium]|nr:signal recognition particle protein [Gammaproteobacteria bacterium]NNC98338.1 signal recognition particle protein [Gammaproteobacteria bacterium]NNM14403.1 signal recognition particle protein [Gammaproteobacteria bacterium]
MFDRLSERLTGVVDSLKGKGRITEDNIKDTLRQVRMALLEADVALPVVKGFVSDIKEKAVGETITKSLTPGQALIKLVHAELVEALGSELHPLNLNAEPPAVILLAGLQGAGKTTSAAKLALHLQAQKKKVAMVSADVYRPAAIKQLETLSSQVGANYLASSPEEKPLEIVQRALNQARLAQMDVLIVDTAGRLGIDSAMMDEVQALQTHLKPAETLFVVDSMAGQDAVNAAKAFADSLDLTGVVLTKADGDARGGVALSVRQITGAAIKFIGLGEKIDALEVFHPDRIASRILGMGDVLSLVEQVEQQVDKDKAEKLARKFKKGKAFDLVDLKDQYEQMLSMGGLGALLEKLPGGAKAMQQMPGQLSDKMLKRQIALIDSMTPQERHFVNVINPSRKRRIAAGAGQQVQDLNRLLKQFKQMQKTMKKMRKGGMKGMMRAMGGRFPGGLQ